MTDRRGAAKSRKAAHKKSRRARQRRDTAVTERYGEKGHRMCGRKARYVSETMARSMAARWMALGAPKLRAYECPLCGGWHLTSKEVRVDGEGRGAPGA